MRMFLLRCYLAVVQMNVPEKDALRGPKSLIGYFKDISWNTTLEQLRALAIFAIDSLMFQY